MTEVRSVELHADAVAEARSAFRWYQSQSQRSADAFMSELDRSITRLQEHPGLGSPHLFSTRRLLFRRFPYALIYKEGAETIQVLAVAHTSRAPGYWKERA